MSGIVQDVLFKTATPATNTEPSEFYELSLHAEVVNGTEIFILREKHGWWSAVPSRVSTDENGALQASFPSYCAALKFYVDRLRLHMSDGFVHSFLWHPVSGVPSYSQKLEKQ
jgi:hypothetical protein